MTVVNSEVTQTKITIKLIDRDGFHALEPIRSLSPVPERGLHPARGTIPREKQVT